jgi:tRNA(Ile)-lysidine synthase
MKAFVPDSSLDRVLTTISRYNMLRPGDRVVAAVSGGADSVFLLHALHEIAPRLKVTLGGVAHLNHKLRGKASEEDEQFVEELTGRVGVPFYREEARVGEAKGNLEEAARRARMTFFGRLIREGKADCVATGHTRDDQAETVLFRTMRGAGLAGLAGILPVTGAGLSGGRVIRPLLDTPRAEIEEWLKARRIRWREDASNRDDRFARNRIRYGLLPQLEGEWNPELRETLARMADLAGEEERWWGAKISRLAEKEAVESRGGVEISTDALARLPKAVSRRLIRHLIRKAGGYAPEFEHVEKTIALAGGERGSGCLELPGLLVARSFDWLRFAPAGSGPPQPEPIRMAVGPGFQGRYQWDGGWVCLEVTEKARLDRESGEVACVRLKWKGQATSALLELRGWRDGDHYRPGGRSRDQKLKEMFQKGRIPSWKRGFWPIVTSGSKILWAREFGPAAAADPERTGGGLERGRGGWLRVWEEFPAGHREENYAGL